MQLEVIMWLLLREVGDPMGLKLSLNFTCIEQLPDSFLSNVGNYATLKAKHQK